MAVKYKFKTVPYEHQTEAIDRAGERKSFAFFMEMGTGKSKTLIDNLGQLAVQDKVDFCLIIAPKGVYRNWVTKELPEHMSDAVNYRVIRWVTGPNKKQLEEMRSVRQEFDGLTIFVMNVESFSTSKGQSAGDWLAKKFGSKGMIAIDESTTIKNRKATRTKNVMMLAKDAMYKRILTGSPITKSPMDLFSQCMFLSPAALNFNSYFAFQNRYAIVQKRTMGTRAFQEITGYRRLDELNQKLDRFSNRTLKEDC